MLGNGNAQFTVQKIEVLKKGVVRVDAGQCTGSSRSATGFFWHQQGFVVTALHVVSGCGNITVHSEAAGQDSSAKVIHSLRAQDLALLQLGKTLPGTDILDTTTQSPSLTEDLEALGYPLSIPKLDNTTVRLRYGGRQLRDIVPQQVADELKQIGSPSPDIDITDIEGHLLPGHSGAPILNVSGKVVAIADGGLENGAVGVSWGLPAANLTKLLASSEQLSAQTAHSAHLFAAETTAQNGPVLTCGGEVFKHIRTLQFADIQHAADDPVGLQQILAAAGQGVPVSSFTFDVYQQASSGATFVVPGGSSVVSEAGMCVSRSASGSIVLRAQLVNSANDPMGQQASVAYEQKITGDNNWQLDPAWSYAMAVPRFDGFWKRRKSAVHYVLTPGFGPVMNENLFESLLYRNGVFLGVAAVNSKWTPEVVQLQQACRYSPQVSPGCPAALADFSDWVQAGIAVHLATFPIG
jgi:hypothetical protein